MRRSSPTSSTFLFSRERLMAVLRATNDLPSPDTVEVKVTTLLSAPSVSSRLVRSMRKASSMGLVSFSITAMLSCSSCFGTSERIGTFDTLSTSPRVRMRYCSKSAR